MNHEGGDFISIDWQDCIYFTTLMIILKYCMFYLKKKQNILLFLCGGGLGLSLLFVYVCFSEMHGHSWSDPRVGPDRGGSDQVRKFTGRVGSSSARS